MTDFQVVARRGPMVESVHRISLAVVSADGALLAQSGDPDLVTYWRSAAKPFQLLPLLEDGGADRYGLGSRDIALACASHSSEPVHLEATDQFLGLTGATESDLACGPHVPLGREVAKAVLRTGTVVTPRWSNCSGKHTAMVALARVHGWPVDGYERAGHPVQDRILRSVSEWTGVPADRLVLGVDGCATVCYGLPLRAMALAYARLAAATDEHPVRVREAMMSHPELVGGTGRFCTDLMRAMPGRIVAKIGADGIYCAGLVGLGVGLALKVEDGDLTSCPPALFGVLEQLLPRLGAPPLPADRLAAHCPVLLRNTRGEQTGALAPEGTLHFSGTA